MNNPRIITKIKISKEKWLNQKIKYEVDSFGECDMDGGVIYEYWFNIGLKQLPKKYWTKIKKHHKRYMDNYKWMLHERWGVEY